MTAIGSVGPRPLETTTGTTRNTPTSAGPLLPEADSPSPGAIQSALGGLYEIMARLRDAQSEQSKNEIETAKTARLVAEQKREEALARAKEAAEDGGFIDWICDDIGIVGVVAAATGQWGLLLADVAAHKSGAAEATGLDFADEAVEPIADDVVKGAILAASVAATVCTCGTTAGLCLALAGAALSAGGSAVAKSEVLGKDASKWVGLGMQVAAVATSVGGGAIAAGSGAATATAATSNAATAGRVMGGAAAVVDGTDTLVAAASEARRADAMIDVQAAKQQITRLQRYMEMMIDGLREVKESSQKTAETLQGAIRIADETNLVLAQGTRV